MPVTIKSTGGGSVTMTAANTASDYTLTLPAATATVATIDDSGNSSVTGTLSVTGSATAASFIPSGSTVPTNGLYLPAANTIGWSTNTTQVAKIDSSGVFYMNSGYGSVAAAYGCRAWVNFNGTGTVAIRASGNVTSITDNGTGDYTVNFTIAMPDANYAMQVVGYDPGSASSTWVICGNAAGTETAPTTSAIRFTSVLRSTGAAQDTKYTFFAAFR